MPSATEVRAARKRATRKAPTKRTAKLWPTLGGEACEFIEAYCVHGPGPVRGKPVTLDPEEKRFIWSAYEVAPRGHELAGRRRWDRAAYVRRKGVRKTELLDWLTCFELLGPCRFDGWRKAGNVWVPVGRRIVSPYIPVAATSLEQTEDTLWGAIYTTVTEGPLCDEFSLDVGLDRIIELDTGGEMKPVSSSSVSRDGGRPTFSPRDETHLWWSAELLRLNDVLLRNLPKRPDDEPWACATTTAWAPGQGSVAELEADEHEKDPTALLWDMRSASETWDLDDDEQLRQAIIEASGDAKYRTDVERIRRDFRRGTRSEGKRYWLSIPASATADESWLSEHPTAFEECRVVSGVELDADGGPVYAGVDSALRSDSVAVWALQEQPDGTVVGVEKTWSAVDGRVYDRAAVRNWIRQLPREVLAGVGYDPAYFDPEELEDEGFPMVEVPQSPQRMVPACRAGYELIVGRRLRHNAAEVSSAQVVAAVPRESDGGWRLSKGKSQHKIDSAIALCIAEYVRGAEVESDDVLAMVIGGGE